MSACRLTCSHTCQQQQQPRHRSSLYARRRALATATQCQALIFSLPVVALDGLSGRSVRVLQNPYTRMNVLAFCSRVFAGMELRIECSKAMFVRPRSARLIAPSSAARIWFPRLGSLCAWYSVHVAVPSTLPSYARDGGAFVCPQGPSLAYGLAPSSSTAEAHSS